MGDNIVRPDFNGANLRVRERTLKDCKHLQTEVDPVLRTVKCSSCGDWLDPVQVLLGVAKGEKGLQNKTGKNSELVKNIGKLSDEERRLKSRLRRASIASKKFIWFLQNKGNGDIIKMWGYEPDQAERRIVIAKYARKHTIKRKDLDLKFDSCKADMVRG